MPAGIAPADPIPASLVATEKRCDADYGIPADVDGDSPAGKPDDLVFTYFPKSKEPYPIRRLAICTRRGQRYERELSGMTEFATTVDLNDDGRDEILDCGHGGSSGGCSYYWFDGRTLRPIYTSTGEEFGSSWALVFAFGGSGFEAFSGCIPDPGHGKQLVQFTMRRTDSLVPAEPPYPLRTALVRWTYTWYALRGNTAVVVRTRDGVARGDRVPSFGRNWTDCGQDQDHGLFLKPHEY